ncbi:hypothetical protein OIDMADRAFT_140540 [Oidiodendron maius Zn]|uniref:Zinc finger PHD-type domain-containing protein n=1 Tax=Oidiodendron maius (strain Zn) TaxID=913774 RepID=A0A0C3HYZ8_OIDMZ|nr:hypothetical protein OIDMADRAFT_140540 [Oidiodendron maius Zn]
MDSSRRTSRGAARASQPSSSTSSSNSSGRAERATRSHQKAESPRKSTPSGSLSSEPADDTITTVPEDTIQTRRKRGRGEEREKNLKSDTVEVEIVNTAEEAEEGVEEGAEDDEAVRCICGYEDYPGPPQLADEDNATEDLAGFFLQCDVCKVWQHGGCVGIMSEDASPDEYFCDQCRKDLHKIYIAANGQRYSHYLPLYQSSSRTTSRDASFSKDGTRSPRGNKNGRPSSSLQSSKRRSTMNSRDAAYDEEEQLRRAIEASKEEKNAESVDGGTRRGKRGRSDSEDKQDGPKRQRTSSASPSPLQDQRQTTSQVDSDDGATARSIGSKKIRGAAARNHREKELREERERARQDAKMKREGRAERRRVYDSDPPEELPASRSSVAKSTETAAQILDPPSQAAALDTTPPAQPVSHRKGGRPPNSRKGKLGKNQYTKERDLADGEGQSPSRSQSRDVMRGDDNSSSNKGGTGDSKPGKIKGAGGNKVTMSDMRKRVAAILDFISRTQLEMAGGMGPLSDATAQKSDTGERQVTDAFQSEDTPTIVVSLGETEESKQEEAIQEKDFKDLSCVEMMDVLTRQLVKWQKEFE